jgi:hypothetical protein
MENRKLDNVILDKINKNIKSINSNRMYSTSSMNQILSISRVAVAYFIGGR